MRSITVPGRLPERNSSIAATVSAALRPMSRGTGVVTAVLVAWQPEQADAPGGAGDAAGTAPAEESTKAAARITHAGFIDLPPKRRSGGRSAAAPTVHDISMLWFL